MDPKESLILLNKAFLQLTDLPDSEFKIFSETVCPKVRNIARGDLFMRQGDKADEVGFVLNGIFKVFVTSEQGKDYTKRFVSKYEFLGPYKSYITGEPSTINVEALQDSSVLTFSNTLSRSLFSRNIHWQEIGRKVAEAYFCEREEWEFDFLMLDAEARYKKFLLKYSQIQDLITQKDIASYLAISPVSLSRIRAKSSSK